MLNLLLKLALIFEQSFGDETQEEKAKRRILKIKLLDLCIANDEHLACLRASERLASRIAGSHQSELTDDIAGRDIESQLHKAIVSAHHKKYSVGGITLCKDRHTTGIMMRRGERL